MAGKITISTLNNDTGVLATQNGMTGIAKAWVYVDTTGTIQGSFNVSSVTSDSSSRTISFTTAMANANYAYTASGTATSGALRLYAQNGTTRNTTTLQLQNVYVNNATANPSGEGFVCIVFGA